MLVKRVIIEWHVRFMDCKLLQLQEDSIKVKAWLTKNQMRIVYNLNLGDT